MQVTVDVLVPNVNASNGVFIAARVDQGGCYTFLARGIFFFLLFGDGQVVIATDLGEYWFMSHASMGIRESLNPFPSQVLCEGK